jgi:hypothetical protein
MYSNPLYKGTFIHKTKIHTKFRIKFLFVLIETFPKSGTESLAGSVRVRLSALAHPTQPASSCTLNLVGEGEIETLLCAGRFSGTRDQRGMSE